MSRIEAKPYFDTKSIVVVVSALLLKEAIVHVHERPQQQRLLRFGGPFGEVEEVVVESLHHAAECPAPFPAIRLLNVADLAKGGKHVMSPAKCNDVCK